MAVYHMRTGGTMTGAAGASTADDWTLANCYGSNENRWNDIIAQVTDGDAIVFYDDGTGAVVTTHDLGTPNNFAAANNGTITLRSRSGVAAWCVLTGDGTGPAMDLTATPTQHSYIFGELTISLPSHTTAATLIRATGAGTQDLTFRTCVLGPCVDTAGVGSGYGGGIVLNYTRTGTLTFHDTVITRVIGTYNDAMLIRHNGASGSVVITGDVGLEVRDVNISDTSGQFDGSIYLPAGASLASATRIYLQDIEITQTTATHRCFGGVFSESGAINFTLIHGKKVIVTCKQGGAALLGGDDVAVTGGTVRAEYCEVRTDGSENDPGGVCFLFNGGAINIDLIDTNNCYAPFGTALYWGSGAGGTIGAIRAVDNDCRESSAVVYNGGYADQTINSILALRCGQRGTVAGSDAKAIAMNTRFASGGSATKEILVYQFTAIDCSGPDSTWYPVIVASSEATYAMNFTGTNWLMDNPDQTSEIFYSESHATAELNVTINNAKLPSGASSLLEDVSNPIDNGALVTSNILTGSTTLDSYNAPIESNAQTGGVRWKTGAFAVGPDGEPFPSWDISLGGIQSRNVPSHPSSV